ncbi:hypothetical protein C6366_13215 [Desulfonatronum sp. SC1]|nr:hypothetical protein C6366_13215 [Desulfonatronum sp. SC1]
MVIRLLPRTFALCFGHKSGRVDMRCRQGAPVFKRLGDFRLKEDISVDFGVFVLPNEKLSGGMALAVPTSERLGDELSI